MGRRTGEKGGGRGGVIRKGSWVVLLWKGTFEKFATVSLATSTFL